MEFSILAITGLLKHLMTRRVKPLASGHQARPCGLSGVRKMVKVFGHVETAAWKCEVLKMSVSTSESWWAQSIHQGSSEPVLRSHGGALHLLSQVLEFRASGRLVVYKGLHAFSCWEDRSREVTLDFVSIVGFGPLDASVRSLFPVASLDRISEK